MPAFFVPAFVFGLLLSMGCTRGVTGRAARRPGGRGREQTRVRAKSHQKKASVEIEHENLPRKFKINGYCLSFVADRQRWHGPGMAATMVRPMSPRPSVVWLFRRLDAK